MLKKVFAMLVLVGTIAIASVLLAAPPQGCVDCVGFQCERLGDGYSHCETGNTGGGGIYCVAWEICDTLRPEVAL